MVEKNPFCISFGRRPVEYIDRISEKERILNTFNLPPVTDQLFLIMGVRGAGKTVLMNTIANELEQDENWIVLRESASSDINRSIYADLYHQVHRRTNAEIERVSIAVQGTGISFDKKGPDENIISLIDDLLVKIDKKGKRVLVAVDEVTNSLQMRDFAHMFQIECSRDRMIFFLGTGLYENIKALSDEEDLTFLHRAPKIELSPLDNMSVARAYQNIFRIPVSMACAMAREVQGYSFAFQALGYLYWEKNAPENLDEVLLDYDSMLSDASYSKIWSECSEKDQLILTAMAQTESNSVLEIRNHCNGMTSNYFSVYRARLIERGIIVSDARRTLRFALPRFREFVNNGILFSD